MSGFDAHFSLWYPSRGNVSEVGALDSSFGWEDSMTTPGRSLGTLQFKVELTDVQSDENPV